MKIRIDFTVDVDAEEIRAYMNELAIEDETIRQFVISSMVSAGIGCLEESVTASCGTYSSITLLKCN